MNRQGYEMLAFLMENPILSPDALEGLLVRKYKSEISDKLDNLEDGEACKFDYHSGYMNHVHNFYIRKKDGEISITKEIEKWAYLIEEKEESTLSLDEFYDELSDKLDRLQTAYNGIC